MKIKTWLQIIVFFSVSIAISIGIFNGLTVSHVNNAMKKNTLAGEIVKVVNQQRNTASEYLLNHKQVTAFKWQDMYDISVKLLQSKEFKMAEEQLILEDMREDNVNVKRIFTYLVAVQERKVLGKEDIGTLLESEARLRIRLLELVESINTGAYRLSEMSHRDVKNALQRANIFIIVSVCILIVLIIFILLLFGVKIITRLSKLSQGINIIGSGNLDYRVDNKSKDEIGQIAHSFNEMTAKLKESYDRLEEKVKKLEDSEQRLNLVLDSAQMGVWDLNLITDTAIRSLRHDQIFGYQKLQPTWGSQIFLTHIVPEYRNSVKRRFEEAFKTGNFKMECQIIWPDKSLHWIAAEGRVYSDDKGDPVRMMGVVLDITGRKVVELERMQNQQFLENQTKELKSQQRAALNVLEDIKEARALLEKSSKDLLRSNKELEQFAYVASHDLQEPLRMVASFCQKLEKGYKDQLDENAKQYIHFAVDGSKRMQLLVDSLLSFARVGRKDVQIKSVDLNKVLETILQDLDVTIREKEANIRVDQLPVIMTNEIQMTQLFQNLLTNALKFKGDKAPIIHISSQREKDGWEFVVSDNGIGIDEKHFQKLFIIFQRLNRREDYPGTGIGLALCKKIVENFGGKIWVTSKLGQGTSFYFTLNDKPA